MALRRVERRAHRGRTGYRVLTWRKRRRVTDRNAGRAAGCAAAGASGADWFFEAEQPHHPIDHARLIRRLVEVGQDIETLVH